MHRKPASLMIHRVLPEISSRYMLKPGLNRILEHFRTFSVANPHIFDTDATQSYPNNDLDDISTDLSIILLIELITMFEFSITVYNTKYLSYEMDPTIMQEKLKTSYEKWLQFNAIRTDSAVKKKLDELLYYFQRYRDKYRLVHVLDVLFDGEYTGILQDISSGIDTVDDIEPLKLLITDDK